MSAVNFNNQELALMSNSFIVPKYITAPYTTIQNRAQVLDASNMLQAVMGVERIPFRGINLLQKEFGVNGEQVWELESKDARVRFVGSGWYSANDTSGNSVKAAGVIANNDTIEIIYYGTGLNVLVYQDATARSFSVTVDNVLGSPITNSGSAVIAGRNYNQNMVMNIVSGQTLGWHSVKLVDTAVGNFLLYGCEILNQSSSLTIPPGQAFIGNKKDSLALATTSAYNAGFVGTKGGRVSKYLLNGQVSQVVRECPATPSYLTSADHTNEEVVRRLNPKEFGANRADDFSTLTTNSNRAFTLDDGTTTLVGNQVAFDGWDFGFNASGSFFTFTFVGTGFDIINDYDGGATIGTIWVDGVSIGNYTRPVGTGVLKPSLFKICSGLPYGAHTVKLLGNQAAGAFSDFIIYQPKAPTLPVGAIQIADYNVVADYVQPGTDGLSYGSGSIIKAPLREFTYVGAGWVVPVLDPANNPLCIYTITATVGNYAEYTFFGTGFVFTTSGSGGGAQNFTISIDTVLNSTGVAILNITNAGSGTYTVTSSSGLAKVSITGLSLGLHTVRFTKTTNGASNFNITSLSVITPIHINHPTLKIGSMSLLDNTKINALALPVSGPDLSKAKAWVVFDGANSKILESFNVSQVLNVSTGQWLVYLIKPFKTNNYVMAGSVADVSRYINNGSTNRQSHMIPVSLQTDAGTFTTANTWSIVVYGELLDE